MKGHKKIRPIDFDIIQGGTLIDIINQICTKNNLCIDDLRFARTSKGMNVYISQGP